MRSTTASPCFARFHENVRMNRSATSTEPIGKVTSGGFGPSLNAPVAMGYLPKSYASAGSSVFAEVRGQRLAVQVASMPFVPNNYKR